VKCYLIISVFGESNMCGVIDSVSDGLTGLAKSVGLKDAGDSLTKSLGIRGVGDLLGDFDDALYDAGVRWDSVGQIAAVAATIYTGGVLSGAWGQGGWLANTLGVGGQAAAGAEAATTASTITSTISNPAVAAQYATDLAAFGASETAIAGELAASGLSSAAAGEVAMGTQMGLQGSQLASLASGSMTPMATAPSSVMGYVNAGVHNAKNALGLIDNTLPSLSGAPASATTAAAPASSSFWSNPLVQYGGMQMAGNMMSGMAQAQSAEEQYQRQQEEIRRQEALRNYTPGLTVARNNFRQGIIGGQM
jgi:hypothetical protein